MEQATYSAEPIEVRTIFYVMRRDERSGSTELVNAHYSQRDAEIEAAMRPGRFIEVDTQDIYERLT